MELNIKEKFNDFIKVIEQQKIETSNNYVLNECISNKCICSLTSDSQNSEYLIEKNVSIHKSKSSTNNNLKKSSTDEKVENKEIKEKYEDNKSNSTIKNNTKEKKKYKDLFDLAEERKISNDELSLLDDNTLIIKEVKNKIKNLENSSISSESKDILDKNKKVRSKFKFENDEEELEHLFNKIIQRKNEKKITSEIPKENTKSIIQDNLNIKKYDFEEIIKLNDISLIFKRIHKIFYDNVFMESTRGWNLQNNIYVLNFNILKQNLSKVNIGINNNFLSIGYLYNDFENPKSFINKDNYSYWLDINLTKNIISSKTLKPTSKLLTSCIKNLEKSKKFKKKIGHSIYKCFKNKVQVYGNKNIIIDIIFYIKYMNV
jgi:hypothetical protein